MFFLKHNSCYKEDQYIWDDETKKNVLCPLSGEPNDEVEMDKE